MTVSLSPVDVAERRQRVAQLTRAGLSSAAIGAALGITDRSVVRIRHQVGIARERYPLLASDELSAAAELLADGCSYAEVARTLGRSRRAIRCHFPGRGWEPGEIGRFASLSRRAQERMQAVYG